jgi:hypothetical protein
VDREPSQACREGPERSGNDKGVWVVHLTFSSAEAEEEWERDLMANNEKEATRLRTLLQGEIPR